MNVVVTGASRGIGFEIVQAFARQGALKIVGISRNYKQLVELKEICSHISMTEFIPLAYDLQQFPVNEPKLPGLIRQYLSQVNILVNNAGALINKPFHLISPEEIRRIFDVNYVAPALLIKNILPLLQAGQAHVVNISSMGGFQGSSKYKGLSHYSASKSALAVLTECLAEEYKNETLTFNALALGSVQTEMLAEAFPDFRAPVTPAQMGEFIANFAMNGKSFFNGKIIPVALTNP